MARRPHPAALPVLPRNCKHVVHIIPPLHIAPLPFAPPPWSPTGPLNPTRRPPVWQLEFESPVCDLAIGRVSKCNACTERVWG